MKKCLSLLLAALMLAAVLTGCGGNPSTEETDTPADTGTEQAAQTNWNVSSVTGTGTELKFRTGVTAEFGEQLLTLSTCSYNTSDERFVVVAKQVV